MSKVVADKCASLFCEQALLSVLPTGRCCDRHADARKGSSWTSPVLQIEHDIMEWFSTDCGLVMPFGKINVNIASANALILLILGTESLPMTYYTPRFNEQSLL